MAVKKGMGLPKGQHIERLYECEVLSVGFEKLGDIIINPVRESGIPETTLEGFPGMDPLNFCRILTGRKKNINLDTPVNRIRFRRFDKNETE